MRLIRFVSADIIIRCRLFAWEVGKNSRCIERERAKAWIEKERPSRRFESRVFLVPSVGLVVVEVAPWFFFFFCILAASFYFWVAQDGCHPDGGTHGAIYVGFSLTCCFFLHSSHSTAISILIWTPFLSLQCATTDGPSRRAKNPKPIAHFL